MTYKHLILSLLCVLSMGLHSELKGQAHKQRQLSLQPSIMHISLLDNQATPVLHEGLGPGLGLTFARETRLDLWRFSLGGNLLRFQPAEAALRWREPYLSGTYAQFQMAYLRTIKETASWKWALGGRIQQDVLIDFDRIGNFPYVFIPGGIFAESKVSFSPSSKHLLSGSLAIPFLSWITDMPYNQIPRVEGRAPDVVSAFQAGTRLATLNSYQRVDASLTYSFSFRPKWQLHLQHLWAWMHDVHPRNMWAYHGNAALGISYQW